MAIKQAITNHITISGKMAHIIAGSGPLVVTRVVMKSGKPTSFDIHSSLGRYRGIGCVFQGTPVHLFNDTANVCRLGAGEFLLVELMQDDAALDVEVTIEEEK